MSWTPNEMKKDRVKGVCLEFMSSRRQLLNSSQVLMRVHDTSHDFKRETFLTTQHPHSWWWGWLLRKREHHYDFLLSRVTNSSERRKGSRRGRRRYSTRIVNQPLTMILEHQGKSLSSPQSINITSSGVAEWISKQGRKIITCVRTSTVDKEIKEGGLDIIRCQHLQMYTKSLSLKTVKYIFLGKVVISFDPLRPANREKGKW